MRAYYTYRMIDTETGQIIADDAMASDLVLAGLVSCRDIPIKYARNGAVYKEQYIFKQCREISRRDMEIRALIRDNKIPDYVVPHLPLIFEPHSCFTLETLIKFCTLRERYGKKIFREI